jgi:hypothetical protein
MNFSDLQDIVEDAGFETQSYSGRGVYGKKCLSFNLESGENGFDAFLSIAEAIQSYVESHDDGIELEDITPLFMGAKSDSMGLGVVIYFPDIEWEEIENQNGDDELDSVDEFEDEEDW